MHSIAIMANIIGVIVVVFVAVAFITLAILYFGAQKRLIDNGLEDESIRREVKAQLSACRRHFSNVETAERYFTKQKKRGDRIRGVVWGIFTVGVAAVFGFVAFSNFIVGERHIWLGDIAMLTIETDSMATADRSNTYLFDANGVADESDRILPYTFITISKSAAHIRALQPGDVAAFTMTEGKEGKTITVVHRLIEIGQDAEGGLRYTFRGDANSASMAGEYQITEDKIVGVLRSSAYQGVENLMLGYFITYLRSAIGIAMTTIALVMIFIYLFLSDRMDGVYEEKYTALRRQECEIMLHGGVAQPQDQTTGGDGS